MRLSEALIKVYGTTLLESDFTKEPNTSSDVKKLYNEFVSKAKDPKSLNDTLNDIINRLGKTKIRPYAEKYKLMQSSTVQDGLYKLGKKPSKGIFSSFVNSCFPQREIDNMWTRRNFLLYQNANPVTFEGASKPDVNNFGREAVITNTNGYLCMMMYYKYGAEVMDEVAGMFKVGMDVDALRNTFNTIFNKYKYPRVCHYDSTAPTFALYSHSMFANHKPQDLFTKPTMTETIKGGMFNIKLKIKDNKLVSFSFDYPSSAHVFGGNLTHILGK